MTIFANKKPFFVKASRTYLELTHANVLCQCAIIECRYNLFQQLALFEFHWRIIMAGDHVVTPQTGEQYMALLKKIKVHQQEIQQRWQLQ